jgi:signal transduction histidine kinase
MINTEFLSIASHELKTPIAGLKLQAEMAKRAIEKLGPDALSPDRVKKIINNFYNDADRLKRLVDDMLDISRIQSGKLSMKFERLNVDAFMAEVIERMGFNFPKFSLLVNANTNAPVWASWDPLRIEQVITNLICNAFKYANNSEIKLVTSVQDEKIIILVSDSGPGISLENQKLIFDRFKGNMERNESSGLGLGLFIANEIIKAHGGQLQLESIPGKGSSFFVKIPLDLR